MKTKGDITREKILEKARDLFNRKGFSATTIGDLVSATGLQKGSIYFHFSGKNEIASEVLKEAAAAFMESLASSLGGNNPGASIDSFFRSALDKHLARGFVGGCIFGNTALEMSDSDVHMVGIVTSVFDQWHSRLSAVVLEAQKARQIRTDISAGAAAHLVIAAVEGGIMMSRLRKDARPFQENLAALRTALGLTSGRNGVVEDG